LAFGISARPDAADLSDCSHHIGCLLVKFSQPPWILPQGLGSDIISSRFETSASLPLGKDQVVTFPYQGAGQRRIICLMPDRSKFHCDIEGLSNLA
jgi:hypothetical protein